MKKGAAVVNNEELSNQEIKVELNQLELKYKLKELDAKLISEKEDLQTWVLSGQLDEHKGTKKIERKPTKAESEEDISEADRQLHVRIAGEVKAQLEAKGRSTEGVETFEEFYSLLQSEAVMLQKKYQPQLRDGIKIAVDLVNSVKQDEKDGDVDVRVKIAPNTIDKEFSFVLEDNESESTESLITKINNQKSTIFTKNYLSSLSRKDAGRLIDEGMYERYDEFDKRLSSFILTIQQTLDSGNSLTSRDKLKLVEYEEKLQILNRIKNITEDLMVIHNSSKENNTQVYNDSKDHEALGNRNIAFGHHENLTYKDIVILNPNQFVSISGGGNHPKEAIANTNKIKLNSISDEEVEKIKQAKSIAKKYRDILILVPGSTEGNDQFREGEQQQRTNNENGSITERGMQDAERRAFRYFDKNLKTGVKNELLKNSTDQLSKEEETEIQIQLKKAIQENDRIPVEHKDDRFNTTLPKELSNALKEKKEELASLEINNELSKVEGNVHLYSQMTPCEFCAGVKTTLGTTFSSLKITIKSGVKYKL